MGMATYEIILDHRVFFVYIIYCIQCRIQPFCEIKLTEVNSAEYRIYPMSFYFDHQLEPVIYRISKITHFFIKKINKTFLIDTIICTI